MKEYYTDTKYMFNTVYAFIQKKPIIDNCLYIGGVSVSRHDVVKMVGKLLLVNIPYIKDTFMDKDDHVKYGKMVDYLMSRVYEQYDEYMGTYKPMPHVADVANLIDVLYLVFKGKNE